MAEQRRWVIFVCVVCGQHDEPGDCPTGCGHQDGVEVVPAADLARVEAERDQWKAHHDDQVAKKRRLHERYESLVAEGDRLAGALQRIADVLGPGTHDCPVNDCEGCQYEMGEASGLAREALTKGEGADAGEGGRR